MAKIRIAFFAEILIEDFDGASRTMFQLIKRIPHERFELLFFCGKGPERLYGFECIHLPTLRIPFNADYSMTLPQLAKEKINHKLLSFDPQVVHIATPSLLGRFALDYATRHQLPILTIYHTHFIAYIDYYFKYFPFLIQFIKDKAAVVQRNFYNRCNTIYVPAESIADELNGMGIHKRRMKIWKRGIDPTQFSPEKKDPGYLRSLTRNEYPTILFASRLVWEKNLRTLIRIYQSCLQQGLQYNFVIAGDGLAAATCHKEMKQAIFLGKVGHETLSLLYASADVFLFPSVSETCGNVVLEAMASGLPCVVGDGGGSKDFIYHGVNGFCCSPFEEDAYISKIKLLVNDASLRRQFSAEALACSAKYDWDQLVDDYLRDMQQLAGRSTPRTYPHQPIHYEEALLY